MGLNSPPYHSFYNPRMMIPSLEQTRYYSPILSIIPQNKHSHSVSHVLKQPYLQISSCCYLLLRSSQNWRYDLTFEVKQRQTEVEVDVNLINFS